MEYFVKNIEYIVWLQCKTISDTMSPWKHSIQQQTIPDWNILTRNNFNNGVFHFIIQWQIDLPEGVFGIINHDGLSIVNQLKKNTNELIFTMRKWVEAFLAAVLTLPIASANAVLILDVWYLSRKKVSCPSWVTGRFLSEVCFNHSFLVDMELNQSMSYAANFGSCFIMDLIWWALFLGWLWLSGLSKTSRFLMFDVINKRDDILDAADNDDGDDVDKKSIYDQEDTFDVVEDDGDNLDTNKTTPSAELFYFLTLWPWLTILFFSCSHLLWGGCVFLCHDFINECFLEMMMFDVACLILFVTNRGELRKSSSINSYV